jgi:hypothetical protein
MRIVSLALVGCSLAVAACTTTWHAAPGPVPDAVMANAGGTVRVLRKNDVSVVLHNVQMVGDSIVGETGDPPQRMAIALADAQTITVAHTDTSLAKTGIQAVGAVVLASLALAAWGLYELTHIGK